MKKIATKFVLAAASTFMVGSVMAQTDTTATPTDTTQTPAPTEDTTSKPDTTQTSALIRADKTVSLAAQFSALNSNFYAITDKELLNSKQYAIKAEEEQDA
ncbi:MAG: hypothetical protein QM640_16675 [Niabella sp.]